MRISPTILTLQFSLLLSPLSARPVVHDPAVPVALVRGTVFDSLSRTPLAGATVQLAGASDSVLGRMYSARTDDAGRYTIPAIVPGRYVAGFFHPMLDSLGLNFGTRTVTVSANDEVVNLATPSAPTIARVLCPDGTFGDSVGVLVGFVRETRTRSALAGATVTAGWSETIISRNIVRQREPEVAATADSAGWFGMCSLPVEVPLMVRAATRTDTTGYVEITLERGGLRHATFHIGESETVPVPLASSSPGQHTDVTVRRGSAQVSGQVINDRGEPVRDARIGIWGASRVAITNDRGAFRLDSLPGGTHTIEARMIGYSPVRRVVHLTPEQPQSVTIALGERAVTLPTLVVRGELVYSAHLTRFEERRRTAAFGYFVTPREIEQRPFNRLSDLLLQAPGVRVEGNPRQITLTGLGTQRCVPTFFVDGLRSFLSGPEMDMFYVSTDIAAVEVYPRAAQVPFEFQTGLTGCGVVAVWTRPPPMRIRRPGGN